VQDGRGGTVLAEEPFPTLVLNATKAAKEISGSQPRAYGYNFAVRLPQTDPAMFLKTSFIRNPDSLGESFGGTIAGIGLTATINAPPCVVNLALQPALLITQVINVVGSVPVLAPPAPENFVQATVNYHYEGGQPPETSQDLSDQMKDHYERFMHSLNNL